MRKDIKGTNMKKNIFNILLVILLIFITGYFALKISHYGMRLQEEDDKYNSNNASISPYTYSQSVK